jgi:hypothetical protein
MCSFILLVALGASTGCTPEDKAQWKRAMGDLNQDNIKTIAPLDNKKPSE